MLKFLKLHKIELVFILFIAVIYFALRLPNLTLQPIFADEAIYIRWAQVMRAEPTLRFIPLTDGKTPLFMWAMTPFFKIFSDPLFAGRFLSVLSGFATLLGVLFLGWKFFNKNVGIWAALLIAVTPYIVFFDRMALVDSMLAAFSVWSLNFALLLIKYSRLDIAMVLGYFLGGGLLTKPPGMFSLLSLPITILLFDRRAKKREQQLLKVFGLWMVAVFIALVIYNSLRLGYGFNNLSARNQDYFFSPLEIFQHPFDPFVPHLDDLIDWFPKLLTIPILLFSIFGVIWALVKRNQVALIVLFWGLIPLVVEMMLLKTFTARYILFSIPALLVLAAWMMTEVVEKIKIKKFISKFILLLVVLPLPLYFNFYLLTNPQLAPLPKEEREGYLEKWTAGYGLKEIALFLTDEAKKQGIVVGTEGSFGTLPDGLQIYLDDYFHLAPADKQISIVPGTATISTELKQAALEHPTYFVANKSRFTGVGQRLEIIKEYPKAKSNDGSQDAIILFKFL